jgi:DNA repair protein RadC
MKYNLMRFTKAQLIQMINCSELKPVIFSSDLQTILEERLMKYKFAEVEYFLTATLNGAHQLIDLHMVTKGIVNRTMVHPREVFRPAIKENAIAIIVMHNHPSGSLRPSQDDHNITKRLVDAGNIIGIQVLDHLIFGPNEISFLSFVNERMMP